MASLPPSSFRSSSQLTSSHGPVFAKVNRREGEESFIAVSIVQLEYFNTCSDGTLQDAFIPWTLSSIMTELIQALTMVHAGLLQDFVAVSHLESHTRKLYTSANPSFKF